MTVDATNREALDKLLEELTPRERPPGSNRTAPLLYFLGPRGPYVSKTYFRSKEQLRSAENVADRPSFQTEVPPGAFSSVVNIRQGSGAAQCTVGLVEHTPLRLRRGETQQECQRPVPSPTANPSPTSKEFVWCLPVPNKEFSLTEKECRRVWRAAHRYRKSQVTLPRPAPPLDLDPRPQQKTGARRSEPVAKLFEQVTAYYGMPEVEKKREIDRSPRPRPKPPQSVQKRTSELVDNARKYNTWKEKWPSKEKKGARHASMAFSPSRHPHHTPERILDAPQPIAYPPRPMTQ